MLLFVAFLTNCFGLLNVNSPFEHHQHLVHIRGRSGDSSGDRIANNLRSDDDDVQDIRALLPVMRKDLDLSAYASHEADTKNMTDSRLLELVLKDRHLQKKGAVDGFIRVAHLLESYRNKVMQNPDVYDESNASRNSKNGQPRAYSAKDSNSPEELEPTIVARLETIVSIMEKTFPRRNTPRLNMYNGYVISSTLLYCSWSMLTILAPNMKNRILT